MIHHIKEDDIVEVLSSSHFHLDFKRGVVIQSFPFKMAIVKFVTPLHTYNHETKELMKTDRWLVPWKDLKVLDSPRDERYVELEDRIKDLTDDLCITRSVLEISEELRERQQKLINELLKGDDAETV